MACLAKTISALDALSEARLRDAWDKISPRQMPCVPPRLMRHLIAHLLQERRGGGVPKLIERELLRLAGQSAGGDCAPPPRANLSPGARLVREWNGQTIMVDILEEGFRYDDKLWNSLSEIARHVTGTHRSGPRFFGLTRHG